MSGPEQQVVRWYTRARRFPRLIGRTPDGARIWGGPYTITQVTAAGMMLLLGLWTTSLWAHHGLVGNALLLGAATYAVVFGLGKIPPGARTPLAVAAGAWRAVSAPRSGRLGGRPVRLRPPHRVRHHITVFLPTGGTPTPAPGRTPTAAAQPRAARSPAAPAAHIRPRRPHRADRALHPAVAAPAGPPTDPAPTDPAPPGPALTGVQALLAQTPLAQTPLAQTPLAQTPLAQDRATFTSRSS